MRYTISINVPYLRKLKLTVVGVTLVGVVAFTIRVAVRLAVFFHIHHHILMSNGHGTVLRDTVTRYLLVIQQLAFVMS